MYIIKLNNKLQKSVQNSNWYGNPDYPLNYNDKYHIEQCLLGLSSALRSIEVMQDILRRYQGLTESSHGNTLLDFLSRISDFCYCLNISEDIKDLDKSCHELIEISLDNLRLQRFKRLEISMQLDKLRKKIERKKSLIEIDKTRREEDVEEIKEVKDVHSA